MILSSGGQRVNTPILSLLVATLCLLSILAAIAVAATEYGLASQISLDVSGLHFLGGSTSGHQVDGIAPRRVGRCLDKKGGRYATTALECPRMAGGGETECPISPGNPPSSLPGETLQIPITVKIRTMKPTPTMNPTPRNTLPHRTLIPSFIVLYEGQGFKSLSHQLTLFLISYSNVGENLRKEGFPRLFVLSKLGSENRREIFSGAAADDNAGPDIPAPIGGCPSTIYLSQHR